MQETDFRVTERASSGEAFPILWRFISKATPQYLFVSLADGYTNKLRWIDVILPILITTLPSGVCVDGVPLDAQLQGCVDCNLEGKMSPWQIYAR